MNTESLAVTSTSPNSDLVLEIKVAAEEGLVSVNVRVCSSCFVVGVANKLGTIPAGADVEAVVNK